MPRLWFSKYDFRIRPNFLNSPSGGSEEYVKVKKSDWNKMLDAFSKAVSRNHLLEKYEKKISNLEKKIAALTEQVEKLKRFVASRGLGEAFVEFIKSLSPKTMKQKLEDAKLDAVEHNRQDHILAAFTLNYRQYIISSLTISSTLALMLFILCTQSNWSCAFSCSVTSSLSAICSTSKSNLSSACSCIIRRCFFNSPDNSNPE